MASKNSKYIVSQPAEGGRSKCAVFSNIIAPPGQKFASLARDKKRPLKFASKKPLFSTLEAGSSVPPNCFKIFINGRIGRYEREEEEASIWELLQL